MNNINKVLTIIDNNYNNGEGDISNLERSFDSDTIADFLHNSVVSEEGIDSISELQSLVIEKIEEATKELNLVRAALCTQQNQ
jgi:hypothetical protein